MMYLRALLIAVTMCSTSVSWAATYYRDGVACTGNYSVSNRDCSETGSGINSYASANTFLSALNPGDTGYYRSGTYAESISVVTNTVNGTASQRIIIAGYPGETVTLAPTGNIHVFVTSSATNYITLRNLHLTGINNGVGSLGSHRGIRIDNARGIVLEDIESTQWWGNGLIIAGATDTVLRRVWAHAQRTDCVAGNRWYGLYAHHGTNLVVEHSEFDDNPGGGIQNYPGPWVGVIIRSNSIHHNSTCTTTDVGGIIVAADSSGGNVSGVEVYSNLIHHNGLGGAGGNAHGIRVSSTGGGGFTVSGTKVHHNTIWANEGNTSPARALWVNGATTQNTDVRNNWLFGNEAEAYLNTSSTNTTLSHNACSAANSCGTNKITVSAIADCLVSSSDPRLKQGTNPCVDAGTSVSTRPSPVGTPDIGAYERGAIVSAVVAGSHIEATVNAMSGIQPGAGLTGLSLTCVTCTGTPVLLANPKPGSTNIIQISVSGLTGSGTARLNLGATNITDSGYAGLPSEGMAQFLNSLSALDITGTVDNTTGDPTPPASGLYSEFLLDEGSGTVANDNTANNNDGTVSAGVTWVNDTSGTGVTIPTDATYRHVASTYGAAVNPTTNSFSTCSLVLPDTQYSQKVVGSSGGNGTGQRAYYGWATVGGVKQWGIGVQSSGFTSGVTEFPIQAQLTLVCLRFNAATDTANLSVNRTIGTSAAANKSYTSYTLVDDLRVGNDGTFTTNNGGYTVYGMWVWNNTYISDAEVQALYDSLFPAGGAVGGYAEVTHRWQAVYLDGSLNPINFKSVGAQEIEVVAGGAVAIEFQVDCTGGACGPLAVRLHASDIAGNTGAVPQELDAFGLAMWRADTSSILNRGVSTCCLSGVLTEVDGVTILDSVASNTIELAEDSSTMFRFIVRVATDQVGELYSLSLKQDNGAALDGAAGTTPQIRVVAPRAGTGF